MELFRRGVYRIKKTYEYEKTAQVDVLALQRLIGIFAVILLLINIRNFFLGKYIIFALCVLILFIVTIGAFLLPKVKNLYVIIRIIAYSLFALAIPDFYYGGNEGFSILWFFLIPFFSLIVVGMPFGAPLTISFGFFSMLMLWTPVHKYLAYSYSDDYRFFYPIFYWGFALLCVTMDIFYKSYLIRQTAYEEELKKEVENAKKEMEELAISSVSTISQMLDEKDEYTNQHSKRVAEYSSLIAKTLDPKISEKEVDTLYRTALLHDIGKIAVPDSILKKAAALTNEEYAIMKSHTSWGKTILADMTFLPDADLGAIYHHERYDGKGYPSGIPNGDLPLMVRIISISDALDAMNSNRCYRKHCGRDYIISELEKGKGKQFDPDVADVTIQLINEGKIEIL